ncbi:helix-turn-helix domain-containing protein [Jeotgalibacillus haloalkalitolerans]|uniref:Helix-turn-helix domain-containing protein n=1 Tax=Jeotgalibacillus haloalkalitolerans TaxID=3104292 RepID=A0ABU5KKZ7_9BACL|nr:helix-turn-helix domain-containing protein [Jeotgalibacillus sp. HH7-29]MDZ5711611.1 helix-turn-helix domain-containing protein [Jeotgalibacillus sp. HH7-29]
MSIGDRLRDLREKRGISQLELSRRLDIPNQNISNYERGYRTPDYEALKKFADFYEVSTDYILGRDFKQVTDKPLTDRQKYLMDWFMQKEHLFFQDGGSIEDAIDDLEIMFEAYQKMRKRFDEDQKKKK